VANPTFEIDDGLANGAAVTNFTLTCTVADNPARFFLCSITSNASATSITYAGSSLSRMGAVSISSNMQMVLYNLLSPPVGTGTLAVALAGSYTCLTAQWYNVDQNTPTSGLLAHSGSGTAATATFSAAVGSVIFSVLAERGNPNSASITAAGHTQLSGISNSNHRQEMYALTAAAVTTTVAYALATAGGQMWLIQGVVLNGTTTPAGNVAVGTLAQMGAGV
jgi:hypothetical protein